MKCDIDISQLKHFQQRIEKMAKKQEIDALCEKIAKDLAARLWRKIVKRTPVGENRYIDMLVWGKKKDGSARVVKNKDGTPKLKPTVVYSGGTLKKNWRVSESAKKMNIIEVEVYNNIFYASYVEYGHRQTPGRYVPAIGKKLKNSWTDGKFMMTTSVAEIRQSSNQIAEKYLVDYLRRMLNA